MDAKTWQDWRDCPEGPRKRTLLSKLIADNEALAQYYVKKYAERSQFYTANMYDDLLQAARIGLIQALPRWKPEKGGFSAVAFRWALHEMQSVTEHASAITIPRRAFLLRRDQDRIAVFEAMYGRHPTPEEVGITKVAVERARKAQVEMCAVTEAATIEAPRTESTSPEANIDRGRDAAALKAFIAGLSKKDQREFWSGKRPDLTQRAKTYVEEQRNHHNPRRGTP